MDFGYSIIQTSDGGYAEAGYTRSFGAGAQDFYVVKLDSNGNLEWAKSIGAGGNDVCYSIIQTNDGGYAMCGETLSYSGGGCYVVKLDSIGNLLWAKNIGNGGDVANSIIQTSDGGYALGGYTDVSGINKAYVVKLDSNGNIQWTRITGGNNGNAIQSIVQSIDGTYVACGYSGAGIFDIYLIKYGSNGNVCGISSSGGIASNALSWENNGGTISSGGIVGNPTTQTGSGGVVTTLCITVGITENNITDNFVNIFPNPFSTQTTLHSDKPLKDATLTVYNLFGQEVKEMKNISGQSITLQRDNLPGGLYFIRLFAPSPAGEGRGEGAEVIATGKVVIGD